MTMREQCVYFGGPYKHYCGRAEYDDDAKVFHGELIGTRDVITFQAKTLDELGDAFRASVDDYLAFCKEQGEQPEKPFSGKFVARLDPELHRRVSMMAQAEGLSLNELVCKCLEHLVKANDAGLCMPVLQESKPAIRRAAVKKTRAARGRSTRGHRRRR